MNELLNGSQKFSVFVTLRTLEERLRQADAWLQGEEEHGRLYYRAVKLSPEQRALARQRIAEALPVIDALAHKLALEAVDDDAGAHIRAGLSESWANLCDIRSQKLRRYGEVQPGLSAVLDEPVEQLAQLALAIASLM